jgi:hypothetical protein
MTSIFHDDPSVPPPGKRTGMGLSSILPFLVRSRVAKPEVAPHPDDLHTVPVPLSEMPDPDPFTDKRGGEAR